MLPAEEEGETLELRAALPREEAGRASPRFAPPPSARPRPPGLHPPACPARAHARWGSPGCAGKSLPSRGRRRLRSRTATVSLGPGPRGAGGCGAAGVPAASSQLPLPPSGSPSPPPPAGARGRGRPQAVPVPLRGGRTRPRSRCHAWPSARPGLSASLWMGIEAPTRAGVLLHPHRLQCCRRVGAAGPVGAARGGVGQWLPGATRASRCPNPPRCSETRAPGKARLWLPGS